MTIPVTLVAGYLGAGKTTWLNAHLRDGVVPDTLVLVNDFGTINIDAELIDYAGERLLKLSSGCLCCSLSDELGTQLSRIGRWLEPPAALIIETSGVARPRRIADMIHVARRFHLDRIVTLIDLASLERRLKDDRIADLVADQIASADVLSLNRGERLHPSERARLSGRLKWLNATAHVEGSDSNGSAESLQSVRQRAIPRRQPADRPGLIDSPTFEADPDWQRFAIDLPPSLTRQTLEALLAEHADGLARAKGIVHADGRHYVFQWSGGHAEWTPTLPRPGISHLVGIGFADRSFEALITALETLA